MRRVRTIGCMALTQSEQAHIDKLEARLNTPYRQRVGVRPGVPMISAAVKEMTHAFPKVSNAARQWEGADAGFSHTSDGKVIFNNMREQREFSRRYGYTRDYG